MPHHAAGRGEGMGQMALGILYGCEEPDIPHDPEEEEFFYDLVEKFNTSIGLEYHSRNKLRVRTENEGNKSLVGVWVTGFPYGEDGTPDLGDDVFPLDKIEKVYSKNIADAKKLWTKFVKYMAKKHSVELPIATLWLTPCEVA